MSARPTSKHPERTGTPIGRPKTSDRPPGFTRRQLIEAATEVFAERGYEKATLKEIAKRAEVTSATIYRHFENKEDLLFAVIRATDGTLRPVDAASAEASEDATPEAIARFVSRFPLSEFTAMRRLAVELHVVANRRSEVRSLLQRFNERQQQAMEARLGRAVEGGVVPHALDVERSAVLTFVLMAGLSHLDTIAPDLIDDAVWISFLESTISDLLTDSTWTPP